LHAPTEIHSTAPDLQSIRQAADRLGFTYRHVRRLIAQGRLDAQIVSRNRHGRPVWRTTSAELDRFESERSAA
jgi:excisionase family DNA binding protein